MLTLLARPILLVLALMRPSLAGFVLRKKGVEQFIEHNGALMSVLDVIRAWQGDASLQEFFISVLKEQPHDAFFWEMPPISMEDLDADFRFVTVDGSRAFKGTAGNPRSFQHHFDLEPARSVVAFVNLGGDAVLVVPQPLGPHKHYAHLAAFVRGAPESQARALLRELGKQLETRLERGRVFVSTAGLGVPWLHLRLDDRPKYYRHQPYKNFPAAPAARRPAPVADELSESTAGYRLLVSMLLLPSLFLGMIWQRQRILKSIGFRI